MLAKRFTNRLLLFNLVLIIVLLGSGGLALSFLLDGYLRADFRSQQGYRVTKMAEQLDAVLDGMNRQSMSIFASQRIRDIMLAIPRDDHTNYFMIHPAIRYEVLDLLLTYSALKPLRGRTCLVSDQGDLLDLSNLQDTLAFTKPELSVITALREKALGGEPKVLLPPGPELWSARQGTVISFVRRLQDTDQHYGWLEINVQVESFGWIWEAQGKAASARIGLYDRAGSLLYANFEGAPASIAALHDGQKLSSGSATFQSDLANAEWRLAYFADSKSLDLLATQTRTILALILLSAFALTAFFSWLALSRITRPVRTLTEEVRGITGGISGLMPEFSPQDPRAPEEIVILTAAFQDLLHSLGREHEERLRLQGLEMSARMAALQAQLNPHFVFNTLTCIAAYGRKGDGTAVQRMCKDLSSMLRYALQNPSEPANLEEELDQAEGYLLLMDKRYSPYLEYKVERCRGLADIQVPRLLLQPIIENCFVHGFADSRGPRQVWIKAGIKGPNWEVSVRDSGKGIGADRAPGLLEEFHAAVAQESQSVFDRDFSRGKLGLLSTFARLRALYGEEAVFSLDSPPGNGLIVRIGGPHGQT
ncbi:MAG: histidine kinase [Spirochaetota bacterium]